MIIKCFIYGVLSIIEKSPPLDLQGRAFFVSGVVFGFHQPFYGFGLLGIRLKAFPICLFGLFNVLGQSSEPLPNGFRAHVSVADRAKVALQVLCGDSRAAVLTADELRLYAGEMRLLVEDMELSPRNTQPLLQLRSLF